MSIEAAGIATRIEFPSLDRMHSILPTTREARDEIADKVNAFLQTLSDEQLDELDIQIDLFFSNLRLADPDCCESARDTEELRHTFIYMNMDAWHYHFGEEVCVKSAKLIEDANQTMLILETPKGEVKLPVEPSCLQSLRSAVQGAANFILQLAEGRRLGESRCYTLSSAILLSEMGGRVSSAVALVYKPRPNGTQQGLLGANHGGVIYHPLAA